MINLLLFFATAGFLTLVTAASLLTLFRKQLAFNQRVDQYFSVNMKKKADIPEEQNKKSIAKNITEKYWERGTTYLNSKVSRSEKKKLDQLLRDAGNPFKSAVDFRLFQFVLSIGLMLAVVLLLLPSADSKAMAWLMTIVLGILGFRLPVFYLGKKKTARIKAINKAMPDYFDTVNLLLEAGMGLDLALVDVSRKLKGPLSEEFLRTIDDMKHGMSRREAFYELKKRVPSDSFQSVINSLIQADQMGIGMAKVLGNLTRRVREQRREAAREQAMKAPVKMLFPMVFFIFPALFIVILGPLVVYFVTKGFGG
ncbi:hypothetical protein DYI25_19355 [Mesobacillus boroniphilus]|uniref:Type II secretion system protein GspF domain-containing protein n=1 Tax=Mesobacillus boroniphilus TaxID=308892 RepID=A0A944CP62_9BACI|nr:type II secretion system F family protein [Mesobacillus boroniphilus]MBS8266584.1 hypothetical protein [Mesobacillus boroniphilus]